MTTFETAWAMSETVGVNGDEVIRRQGGDRVGC